MNKPSYYAVIPAEVRYDNELSADEKLMYGELTCLTSAYGYCWASNAYFARLYNKSERTIQRWLYNLEIHGYIKRDINQKSGTDAERKIYMVKNDRGDKIDIPPYDKNDIYNNTRNNNIKVGLSAQGGECPATPGSNREVSFNF